MKILLTLFLTLICGGGMAIYGQTSECATDAWITDKDPNGLNVRDKPGVGGKVISRLKNGTELDDEIIITVTGYADGWVKISRAVKMAGDEVFSGTGWVSAKMVAVGTQSKSGEYGAKVPLYEKASKTSRKIASIPNETIVRILGFDCFGLKVAYQGKTGWLSFENVCGNPETTCV